MSSSNERNIWVWAIAIAALAINLITVSAFLIMRNMVAESLTQANQNLYQSLKTLETYQGYPMEVNLSDSLSFPANEQVRFNDVIQVPINAVVNVESTIPFQDQLTVPINTSVRISDIIQAPINIQGAVIYIDVPIDIEVPINENVSVPISTTLPVTLDVPINLTLDVPIDEMIPLQSLDGSPLALDVNLNTSIPLPLNTMLDDVQMRPVLTELHNTLNILETLLWLPAPEMPIPTP
ncbi:MAG: hypothetical protein ACPG8W_04455 [Candidatus Promineifilaceae bacterium]